MRFLAAPTEDFIKFERTVLSADVTAGTSVALPVQNSDGLSVDDFIVIGHEGSELAELQQINQAVSAAGSVRVATLKFNHTKGEPVVRYRYNQRKFYGATTAGGTYTELTSDGSPKGIQVDDPQGTVLEYSADTYSYFKATYYNSTLLEETDEADSEAVQADESLRYTSLWAIRKHAGLAGNPFYSDLRLETKRKQAENEINSVLSARYVLPLAETPALLGQICELLAAGYIDYEEFGSEGQGAKWLGEARALLKALRNGTQLLIGVDGTELTRHSKTDTLDGYPNAADIDDAQFTMADRY
jgi:phage gp36-like protein